MPRRSAAPPLCLLLAFAAATALGCARRAGGPRDPADRNPYAASSAYPYAAADRRVFFATAAGLVEATPAQARSLPVARAPNASVLTSDGDSALVALNGWGTARLETERDGQGAITYRLALSPLPLSFAGLTTGGAWPLPAGGFLVQLYRDPFGAPSESSGKASETPMTHAAGRGGTGGLVAFDASGAASALDPFTALDAVGFAPFALMPSGGAWFAELRSDEQDRARMRFFRLKSLGSGSAGAREIGREEFEDALRPRSISELPPERAAALGAALDELAAQNVLVRARDEEGGDAWYFTGMRAEDCSPAYAWFATALSPDGATMVTAVWLLLRDGSLARATAVSPAAATAGSAAAPAKKAAAGPRAEAARLRRIEPPVPDARFVALAAGGGIVAAAWEAGALPELSAAGIVVAAEGE